MRQSKGMPRSPISIWSVSTEGDCEGRSTKQLGVFQGHIIDIANYLNGKECYGLRFEECDDIPYMKPDISIPHDDEIHISLDISTGTWDMDNKIRSQIIGAFLASEPAKIKYRCDVGDYYASVKLDFKIQIKTQPIIADQDYSKLL